jgi:UDP-glucuronate decarboxylase
MKNYNISDDLGFICSNCLPDLKSISNKSILITGGSGFFGKWFIESIAFANINFSLNISLTLITRDKSIFLLNNPKFIYFNFLTIVEGNILKKQNIKGDFDYLLHMATTTAHETFNGELDESKVKTLEVGTENIIDFAIKNKIPKLLFTSSGVIYGQSDKMHLMEQDFVKSPIVNKGTGLAQGKILAETIITNRCRSHNINYKIARCFSFVGPYLPLDIHYAIGNFINDARQNRPIVLRSEGKSVRSYLYIADTIIWLLKLLVCDEEGVFNVGSERQITIYDLAHKVRDMISPSSDVVIVHKDLTEGNFTRDIYVPSVSKIKSSLGVEEWTSLEDSILKTAKTIS